MDELERVKWGAGYKADKAFTALMDAAPKDRPVAQANLDQACIERDALNWEPETLGLDDYYRIRRL